MKCQQCDREFIPHHHKKWQKFCSPKCGFNYRYNIKKPVRACMYCKAVLYHGYKFCDIRCARRHRAIQTTRRTLLNKMSNRSKARKLHVNELENARKRRAYSLASPEVIQRRQERNKLRYTKPLNSSILNT